MEGLLGLTQNIKTRDTAIQELSVLERMDSRIQQDRQNEYAADQQQQMFFEQMYAAADQLLEKDRNNINNKIRNSQRQVRDHLDKYGGSKARFMQEGGFSTMNEIKNGIVRSDEAVRYQENKKNLAKILEIKEKGMGHLLSPTDLKSLEDYEASENGGLITYSGIMTEVEIPPSANFDYGTDIPIEKIINYNSNAIKIRQNYEIAYPDAPKLNPEKNRDDYLKLIAFAKEMGYGGTGSSTVRLRQAAADAKARAEYERKNPVKSNSYLNQITQFKQQIPKGITIAEMNEKYEGSALESMKSSSQGANKLFGEKVTTASRKRSLSEKGADITDFTWDYFRKKDENFMNSELGLRDAHEILPYNKMQVAEGIFDTFKIENGQVLDFMPDENMFRMDGVKLTKDHRLDPDDHTGAYEIVNITSAWKTKLSSEGGQEGLVVTAYNDDGSLDENDNKKLDEGYKNNLELTTVIALRNKDGDLFYKEINLDNLQHKTAVGNMIAEDDDISETVQQQEESAKVLAAISANTNEEQVLFKNSMPILNQEVFSDPLFESEGKKYYGAHSAGQNNRYDLMKSFYMAFDYIGNSNNGNPGVDPRTAKKAITQEIFTTSMISGGLEEDLRNYEQGNSNEKLIGTWLKNVNEDLTEGSLGYRNNQQIASKWMQLVSMVR